jgi:hypothetical protein
MLDTERISKFNGNYCYKLKVTLRETKEREKIFFMLSVSSYLRHYATSQNVVF